LASIERAVLPLDRSSVRRTAGRSNSIPAGRPSGELPREVFVGEAALVPLIPVLDL
jgi:hypothetical protein